MDIMKTLLNQLGDDGISEMASKVGANKEQTSSALEGIMPTLLNAMSANSKSKDGANGLLGALDRDHDGSVLDDLPSYLQKDDHEDGGKILKHVLGEKQGNVEEGLSMKTGLGGNQINKLMKMAAPLLMGFLGKQKKSASSGGGFDLGSISSLLGGFAKDADKATGLDLGDVMDLVGGLGGGSKKGGIGGLLGNLFGK